MPRRFLILLIYDHNNSTSDVEQWFTLTCVCIEELSKRSLCKQETSGTSPCAPPHLHHPSILSQYLAGSFSADSLGQGSHVSLASDWFDPRPDPNFGEGLQAILDALIKSWPVKLPEESHHHVTNGLHRPASMRAMLRTNWSWSGYAKV